MPTGLFPLAAPARGPRPELFSLADRWGRWAMLSSRWPLWTRSASKALPACRACHPEPPPPPAGTRNRWKSMARGAPLLATFGLLFTLAGADPPTEVLRNPPCQSGSVSSMGPRVFCVRLGLVRFLFCGVLELERKRSIFSRHPFRYLRMRHPSPRG